MAKTTGENASKETSLNDEDLFESKEYYQAFEEMEERLEIRSREFQIEEDKANIFASQLRLR